MRKGETFEPDWVLLALEAIARHTAVPQCRIGLRIPHPSGAAGFIIEGGAGGTRIAKGESRGIAAIEARFDVLLQILARRLSLDEAPSPAGRQGSRAARRRCAGCRACLSLPRRSVDGFELSARWES